MIIDRITYTNINSKKESKKAIMKNAKKRRFEYNVFVPLNRIKGSKNQHIMEQLYAILDAKKLGVESVLIADGKVIFDFAPQMLALPPDDYDVVFLNGDIRNYIYPSEAVVAEKQKKLDMLHGENMLKKWGTNWKEWLDWWKSWNDNIEMEFQTDGDKEIQRKATDDEIKEHWELWFIEHDTDNKIMRNLKDNNLVSNEYFRYLLAIKDENENGIQLLENDNENETEIWLIWMNLNIKEGNEPPVYHGESGLWFSAKMDSSNAYVINGHNENFETIFKTGKEYFAQEENKNKNMAQFLTSAELKTLVINRSMCGSDNQDTPEKLQSYVVSEQNLDDVKDEDLPTISVVSPVFNNEDGFFLTMMSFQLQNYPRNKVEWIIVDDSAPGHDVQKMIPEKENRIRYLRCSVKNGNRLTFGRKLNIGCKNATGDIIVVFTEGMYYPSTSLKTRALALINSPKHFDFVGCSRMGFYGVKNGVSYTVQQQDVNNHSTVFHQDTIAFTRGFWSRRLFHEGLVNDFNQNIAIYFFNLIAEDLIYLSRG